MPDSKTAKWTLYCDGACQGNPGPASWGAVLSSPEGAQTELKGFLGRATNQIAEIQAAINGLRGTPQGATVSLHSDSQYVVKGISEWRKGWERRGLKTAKGDDIANKGLWVELFTQVDARKVSAHWVKGHNGHPQNERADALARSALA